MKYVCQICNYVYDEEAEGVPFADLPDDWTLGEKRVSAAASVTLRQKARRAQK